MIPDQNAKLKYLQKKPLNLSEKMLQKCIFPPENEQTKNVSFSEAKFSFSG